METQTIWLFALSLYALLATGMMWYSIRNAPELIPDDTLEELDSLELSVEGLVQKYKAVETQLAEIQKELVHWPEKVRSLENEFSELHEFVNRNMKKMNTRAWRAEMQDKIEEDIRSLESQPDPGQKEIAFSANGSPRIRRARR